MSRRPALLFFGLACALSWTAELAGRALDGATGDALHTAAKFGPSIAGAIAAFGPGAAPAYTAWCRISRAGA